METRTKWILFNWSILIAGIIFILGLHISRQKKRMPNEIIKENNFYKIGEITINSDKNQIQFKAKIFKNKGWVQHLIYLRGYKWLKKESAIISEAGLFDLQNAIAFLDKNMWNDLWYGKNGNKKLFVFVKCDSKEIPGQEFVLAEDRLKIGDFIFLGSPSFDRIVLNIPLDVDCSTCSIFPLEEKVIREGFKRSSGQSGYELNSFILPSEGTEVDVVIKLGGAKS